jgi:hypothetical protein
MSKKINLDQAYLGSLSEEGNMTSCMMVFHSSPVSLEMAGGANAAMFPATLDAWTCVVLLFDIEDEGVSHDVFPENGDRCSGNNSFSWLRKILFLRLLRK